MKTVVSNASPLIILAKANLLDLLQNQFLKVLVPLAVVNEIKAGPSDDPMHSLIDKLPWIEQVELVPSTYRHLHTGASDAVNPRSLNMHGCILVSSLC